jgi:hypothetical protein
MEFLKQYLLSWYITIGTWTDKNPSVFFVLKKTIFMVGNYFWTGNFNFDTDFASLNTSLDATPQSNDSNNDTSDTETKEFAKEYVIIDNKEIPIEEYYKMERKKIHDFVKFIVNKNVSQTDVDAFTQEQEAKLKEAFEKKFIKNYFKDDNLTKSMNLLNEWEKKIKKKQ